MYKKTKTLSALYIPFTERIRKYMGKQWRIKGLVKQL